MAYPKGFVVTGIHAGIKRNPQKNDLGIIFSQVPATVAGVTTLNQVVAAPIVQARKVLKSGVAQAIVVNSGNANACTGKAGDEAVKAEVRQAAKSLKIKSQHVVIASTGIIGVVPPVEKLVAGISAASSVVAGHRRDAINRVSTSGKTAWDSGARAIMTTDLTMKQKWVTVKHNGKSFVVGGIAKGSGMIHPNMATMLGFVVTDLGISRALLQKAVVQANRLSFNRITVDGDTSTNDMAMVMANGASGLSVKSPSDSLLVKFQTALNTVFIHLAKEIIIDGEGATKLVTCRVTGARSEAQAEKVAKTIIGSSLFKTMIHGEDPNWGRVIAVAGYSGEKIDQHKLNLWFGAEHIFKLGQPLPKSREVLRAPLLKREFKVRLDLGQGKAEATCWGCDLSYDYVKINTAYS